MWQPENCQWPVLWWSWELLFSMKTQIFCKARNSMLVLSTDANVSVHSQSNLARLQGMKYKVAFLINIATLVQFWQDKVTISWTWAKHVFICTCRGNKLKNNFEYERFTRLYENHFIAVSQRRKGSSEKNKLKSQWILIMSFLKIENYFYYLFIECLFCKEK